MDGWIGCKTHAMSCRLSHTLTHRKSYLVEKRDSSKEEHVSKSAKEECEGKRGKKRAKAGRSKHPYTTLFQLALTSAEHTSV